MASPLELLQYATALNEQEQAASGLGSLVKPFARGLEQGIGQQQALAFLQQQERAKQEIELEKRRRALEQLGLSSDKTTTGKIGALVNGDFKVDRQVDLITGDLKATAKGLSDSEKLNRDLGRFQNGEISEYDLRVNNGQFQDKIDDFILATKSGAGIQGQPTTSTVISRGGTPIKRSSQTQDEFMEKGTDAFGRSTGTVNLGVERAKDEITTEGKQEAAKRAAFSNIDLVTGAARELSQTYVDALKEGGVGSKFNELKSKGAIYLGGDAGDKFPATGSFSGQKVEVVARMMPLLTQQGEKAGSTRLVESIFRKLEGTLPSENTPPNMARRMMEQSIRNMFRFSRAVQRIGATTEQIDSMPEDEYQVFINNVNNLANTMRLTEEEDSALNNLINASVEPIDNYLSDKKGDDHPKSTELERRIAEARKRGLIP